jgi:hypothetical protein
MYLLKNNNAMTVLFFSLVAAAVEVSKTNKVKASPPSASKNGKSIAKHHPKTCPQSALEGRAKSRATRPAQRFDPDASNQQSQMENGS